jgi:hypothetical protein
MIKELLENVRGKQEVKESVVNEAKAKREDVIAELKKLNDEDPMGIEKLRVALMNRERTNTDGQWQAEYFYGSKKKLAEADMKTITDFMSRLKGWITEEDLLKILLDLIKTTK